MSDSEKKFYVYFIINPITNRIIYVGKGCGHRCKQHLTDKKEYAFNKRLNGYIRNLIENKTPPVIKKIAENLTEQDAYELEESEIKRLGRVGFEEDGILLNILESGRPPRFQKENHPWWGKKHTKETKEKLSKKMKENYRSGKVEIRRGFHHSEETKQKISISKKGVKRTPEAIEKTRQARMGKPQTSFQKQKAREANQKKWLIIKPDGTEEIVINLRKYCLENNLDQGNMVTIADNPDRTCKGYQVFRLFDR